MVRSEVEGLTPSGTTAPRERRRRILVVDDDALVGRALGRLLCAHDVTVVESGAAALAACASGAAYDLVLSDLVMPGIDGMQLYAALGEQHPALQRRVVFVTAGATTDVARTFLETVPNPYILKPFNVDELKALIARYLA